MRRGKARSSTDDFLGQHIALSVAAGLARTQLSADPLRVYDAQHFTEILDLVARALAKVAPLYVRDGKADAEPRQLTVAEQETAAIRRGATRLVLPDGTIYSSVTMRRGDLRQAIAVLKAVGVPELAPPPAHEAPAHEPAADVHAGLLAAVADIERLLAPPLVRAQVERANRLALSIARKGPQGRISNLAMQLMSCLYESADADVLPEKCWVILARLRAGLEELEQSRA